MVGVVGTCSSRNFSVHPPQLFFLCLHCTTAITERKSDLKLGPQIFMIHCQTTFRFQNRNGKRFVIEIMSSTCSFQSSTCVADSYKLDEKHTRVKGVVYVDDSTENLEYRSRVECPVTCLPSIRSVLTWLLTLTQNLI